MAWQTGLWPLNFVRLTAAGLASTFLPELA